LSKPLTGLGVLVTRPKHQATAFIHQLEQTGAHAISFPSIEIHPVKSGEELNKQSKDLEKYHSIIFISANAVDYGANWLKKAGKSLENQKIIAIGKSTSKALTTQGIKVDITPEKDFSSEALLKLPSMQSDQLSGQQILIIRGEGGRELLANTLKSRGAHVEYAEVYRRSQPVADIEPILELWSKGLIQLVTVTSNEALKNLYHMMNKQGQKYLQLTSLIVPGQRCAELAQQLGFTNQVMIASSATDDAMIDAITSWQLKYGNKTN